MNNNGRTKLGETVRKLRRIPTCLGTRGAPEKEGEYRDPRGYGTRRSVKR